MAKIKDYDFKVNNGDTEKWFKVPLKYLTKQSVFAAELPEEFKLIWNNFTTEVYNSYGCMRIKVQGEIKTFVTGPSEAVVCQRLRECYSFLVTSSVTKRDVILIRFDDGKSGYSNDNDDKLNKQHQPVKLVFGLGYAEESTLPGAEPVYTLKKPVSNNWGGKVDSFTNGNRRGVSLVVIDDTPAARIALEDIYKKLGILINALKGYTKDAEAVTAFIQSSVKLLA